jgi:DNA polymerase III delta prime subunit
MSELDASNDDGRTGSSTVRGDSASVIVARTAPTTSDAVISRPTLSEEMLNMQAVGAALPGTAAPGPPVAQLHPDVMVWTVDDVSVWLRQNGLNENVVDAFKINQIRGRHLPSVTNDDLIQYGVTVGGDRKDILSAITQLPLHNGTPSGVMDDNARHRWQKIARENRSYSHGMDGLCLVDDVLLNTVMDDLTTLKAQHAGKVLIRGPPGCGKTTFADKFCEKFEGKYAIFSVSLLYFKESMEPDDLWPTLWDNANITIQKIVQRAKAATEPIILIIDECQVWYNHHSFWAAIVKDKPHNLKFLFLAAFGEPNEPGLATPDEVGNCFYGFDHLRLSLDKTTEIAKRLTVDRTPFFPETLQLLHQLTNGHARITRGILKAMAEQDNQYATMEAQMGHLKKSSMVVELVGTFRSFKMLTKFVEELHQSTALLDAFLDVLFQAKRAPVYVADSSLRGLMVKSGMFTASSNASAVMKPMLKIICPFAFDVLLATFLRGTFEPEDSQESFQAFLTCVLLAIDPHRLWASIDNLGNPVLTMPAIPLEDFCQKEFYRAATTILRSPVDGNPYLIESDVGGTSKAKAECDFVINGKLGWAIELLRDGNDIDEHVARMDPDSGSYRNIKPKRKAVINFMFKKDYSPRSHHPILWHVVYTPDKKMVTIFQPKDLGYNVLTREVIVNASMRSPTA